MSDRKSESSDVQRRRGRPIGKNRVPLSLAERRARNAQYERERRSETADAMAQLAEAAGCDISIPNAELLATVLAELQRASKREAIEDIDTLRRCNESYMQQIAELEERLGLSDVKEREKENLHRNTKAFKKRAKKNNIKDRPCEELQVKTLTPTQVEKELRSNNIESNNLEDLPDSIEWPGVDLLDFTDECYRMIEQWETDESSFPPFTNSRNTTYQP